MGRAKYSPEARNAIMAAFVKATKKVIDEEGIEAASIRRVSTTAGYSSATLYLYFEDMSELVAVSLISYLSEYVRDTIESTPENESPEEQYRRTWVLFCKHAFARPSLFLNLYYGPQSDNLDVIAEKYYELFPGELERATGDMFEMLKRGNLRERNRVILESFAGNLGLTEHETILANDLTIAYFHSFLLDAKEHDYSKKELDKLVDRFMEGAFFVLRHESK